VNKNGSTDVVTSEQILPPAPVTLSAIQELEQNIDISNTSEEPENQVLMKSMTKHSQYIASTLAACREEIVQHQTIRENSATASSADVIQYLESIIQHGESQKESIEGLLSMARECIHITRQQL
jgi:hypothetical protein